MNGWIKKYIAHALKDTTLYIKCKDIVHIYPSILKTLLLAVDKFQWQTAIISLSSHCPFLSQPVNQTTNIEGIVSQNKEQ